MKARDNIRRCRSAELLQLRILEGPENRKAAEIIHLRNLDVPSTCRALFEGIYGFLCKCLYVYFVVLLDHMNLYMCSFVQFLISYYLYIENLHSVQTNRLLETLGFVVSSHGRHA